jgi:hypothetical protein
MSAPKPIASPVEVPARWSINRASQEFNIDRRTLAKSLRADSQTPGQDEKYSTRQICSAVFSDYDVQRARKMTAEANIAERRDAEQNERMTYTEDAAEYVTALGQLICRTLDGWPQLDQQTRRDLVAELNTKCSREMLLAHLYR